MRTVTLADVRQLIVDECDLDTPTADTHVTEAMLTRWVNLAAQKLTAALTDLRGDDWTVWSQLVQTIAGSAEVVLPVLAYHLKQVVWIRSADEEIALQRAAHAAMLSPNNAGQSETWETAPRYALMANTLILSPMPSAVYSLRLVYTELYPPAVNASDPVLVIGDATMGPAWEEYLLYDVAARVYQRQEKAAERDYAFARAQDAEQRIRSNAAGIDENEPRMAGRVYDRRLLREDDYE